MSHAMYRLAPHKLIKKQSGLTALLVLAALLLGQSLSAQHQASYGGHLHTYADHHVAASDLVMLGDTTPDQQHDDNQICDLALFAQACAIEVDLAAITVSASLATISHGPHRGQLRSSLSHHVRPPSRAPPIHSKL